jgi:UV DNA damage repair endonuclease
LFFYPDRWDFQVSTQKAKSFITLQKDLDKLGHWENEWCMKFHPDKCTVLRVTNKKKIIDAKYQLHGGVQE